MCGIAGIGLKKVKRKRNTTDIDFIKNLASNLILENEVRGRDASGIAIINEHNWGAFKLDVAASSLVQTEGFNNTLKLINPTTKVILGHTRLATKGNPQNLLNNHPIFTEKENLICVHNGMIWNDDELFKKENLPRQAAVDSEIIVRLLEKYKHLSPEYVREATEKLGGIFTFAFSKINKPDLWLVKKNNPCYLLEIIDMGLIVFASEKEFIYRGIRNALNKTSISESILKRVIAYEQTPNTIIHIDLKQPGRSLESKNEYTFADKAYAFDDYWSEGLYSGYDVYDVPLITPAPTKKAEYMLDLKKLFPDLVHKTIKKFTNQFSYSELDSIIQTFNNHKQENIDKIFDFGYAQGQKESLKKGKMIGYLNACKAVRDNKLTVESATRILEAKNIVKEE